MHCETNIDECESDPCQNGATCVDQVASYNCQCAPGFRGSECAEEIDECLELDACANGATCEDRIADYLCTCTSDFGGRNCSVLLTGCDVNDCQNGATCNPYYIEESDEHLYTCECAAGFTSELCNASTTASLRHEGYILIDTQTTPELALQLDFRTSLADVVLVWNANADASNVVMLELVRGNQLVLTYKNFAVDVQLNVSTSNEVSLKSILTRSSFSLGHVQWELAIHYLRVYILNKYAQLNCLNL